MIDPEPTLDIQRLVAPGTLLREGIELILRQDSGALIVLGGGDKVNSVCTGGFDLVDAEFTPQRLAELAKMDGAIVIDHDVSYILKANVHLIPDPAIQTEETGTRQRTAERVAIQTGHPAISVSEGRSSATVFTPSGRYSLQSPTTLVAQANQRINTLERFRRRLEDAEERLTRSEVGDLVTGADVVLLLQRAALVDRLGSELGRFAVELGHEGHLIQLQLTDLLEGVRDMASLVYADYVPRRRKAIDPLETLKDLPTQEIYDPVRVDTQLRLGPLDASARPRGLRALSRVPRLPDAVKDSLVDHFGDLQKMLHATVGDFDQVDGVGRARAQQLRHFFDRLLELSHAWEFTDD